MYVLYVYTEYCCTDKNSWSCPPVAFVPFVPRYCTKPVRVMNMCVHVAVFRQGDIGTNWYTVLSGCLEVLVSETGQKKVGVTCTCIHDRVEAKLNEACCQALDCAILCHATAVKLPRYGCNSMSEWVNECVVV